MDEYPTITVRLNIGIQFNIDYLGVLEWNGILCPECDTNIVTMAFGIEVFAPTDVATKTLYTQYDFCIECDPFPEVVALKAAREISEMYSATSRPA